MKDDFVDRCQVTTIINNGVDIILLKFFEANNVE